MESSEAIEIIKKWYQTKCNGTWEHEFGIEIKNIDNPGWHINIRDDFKKIPLTYKMEYTESNWIHVNATDVNFSAYGGPGNLNDLLIFAAKWLTDY